MIESPIINTRLPFICGPIIFPISSGNVTSTPSGSVMSELKSPPGILPTPFKYSLRFTTNRYAPNETTIASNVAITPAINPLRRI